MTDLHWCFLFTTINTPDCYHNQLMGPSSLNQLFEASVWLHVVSPTGQACNLPVIIYLTFTKGHNWGPACSLLQHDFFNIVKGLFQSCILITFITTLQFGSGFPKTSPRPGSVLGLCNMFTCHAQKWNLHLWRTWGLDCSHSKMMGVLGYFWKTVSRQNLLTDNPERNRMKCYSGFFVHVCVCVCIPC